MIILSPEELRYIELEISRYDLYRREIAAERNRILDSSPHPGNSPSRQAGGNSPTEAKAIRLISSPAILRMERSVSAVDLALCRLGTIHRSIFELYFRAGRRDRYAICDELHISERTFWRCRRQIIEAVGLELGIASLDH